MTASFQILKKAVSPDRIMQWKRRFLDDRGNVTSTRAGSRAEESPKQHENK